MIRILITTFMRILCLVTILTVIGIHGDPESIVTLSIAIVGYIWAFTPIYYKLKHYVKLLFVKKGVDIE